MKNLVSADHGAMQFGSEAGPATISGPAAKDAEPIVSAAIVSAPTLTERKSLDIDFMHSSLNVKSSATARNSAEQYFGFSEE